jgi:hypothetical protein
MNETSALTTAVVTVMWVEVTATWVKKRKGLDEEAGPREDARLKEEARLREKAGKTRQNSRQDVSKATKTC